MPAMLARVTRPRLVARDSLSSQTSLFFYDLFAIGARRRRGVFGSRLPNAGVTVRIVHEGGVMRLSQAPPTPTAEILVPRW